MNAKLLFAATVAVSLASTLAVADPLSREQVNAQYAAAAANGTLQRTDYDFDRADRALHVSKTREQVAAEYAAAKQANPLLVSQSDRSGLYNPFGAELRQPSTVARADVKAEVVAAVRDGSLPRTDYEYDTSLVSRRVHEHAARPVFASTRGNAGTGAQ